MTLRVAAFVPHPPSGASSRYRVYDLVAPLADCGIAMEVLPFFDPAGYAGLYRAGAIPSKVAALTRGALRRWRDLARTRADVALVHREIWPLIGDAPLARLRRHQPRWVFDFDDAVWMANVSDANRAFAHLKPFDQPEKLVAGAAAVSAGNAWLADWARARRPSRPAADVAVVPTSVDTRRWTPRLRRSGPPRLVWIGTHSTVGYLQAWAPALLRLARRHPGLELHLVGATLEIPGLRVVCHAWSYDTEVDLVGNADVGLAPLPDDDWSRGKCASKLLLYMALGLPGVASPVGVQGEILAAGDAGRTAVGEAEVERAVQELLDDAGLRERLGRAARARAEADFGTHVVAPRLAAVLRRAAEAS